MRTKICVSLIIIGLSVAGCVEEQREHRHVVVAPVYVQPPPPPPPRLMVVAPAPVYVPEYYVWDGYEYVGWCGGQYVYLHHNGWVICDKIVLGRFHGWEKSHRNWRKDAIRYHGHDPHR